MALNGFMVDGVCLTDINLACKSLNIKPTFGQGEFYLLPQPGYTTNNGVNTCNFMNGVYSLIDQSYTGVQIPFDQLLVPCDSQNTITLGNDYLTVIGMCIIFAVGFTTGNRR